MTIKELHLFVIILCLPMLFAGCSGKLRTEPVTGTVTLDGTPLEGATVSFSPVDATTGHSSIGRTDANGVYKLQTRLGDPDAGTTPGEYLVAISKDVVEGTGKRYAATAQNPEGSEIMKSVLKSPKKYIDAKTSGLTATVVKGKNVFDFDLKSE